MELSFQLYSARNFTPWPDVFAALVALGYRHVEGFGPLYRDPAATRAALDGSGLTMPSLHVSLDMAEGDLAGLVDLAQTLGAGVIYVPWIEPKERGNTAADWELLALRMAEAHARLQAHGLRLGWHNHDFEFQPLADSRIPMQILLDAAPMIEWEVDPAWIVRAKSDPLHWIRNYGQRITAAHFKNIAPEDTAVDEDGWADPGTGIMDWNALHAALADHTRCALLVAEHDEPADLDRFACSAIETFRSFPGARA